MMSLGWFLPLLAFFLSPTPPPRVEPAPSPTPVPDWTSITCDGNLLLDYEQDQATFYHNVLVKNPRGSLQADELIVYFAPGGKKVEKTEASGHVAIAMGEKTGTSEGVVYLPAEKKVILLGKARVQEKGNIVRGEKITFYLDRREMEVEGAPDMKVIPKEDLKIKF